MGIAKIFIRFFHVRSQRNKIGSNINPIGLMDIERPNRNNESIILLRRYNKRLKMNKGNPSPSRWASIAN
jgi:hypothetical protein